MTRSKKQKAPLQEEQNIMALLGVCVHNIEVLNSRINEMDDRINELTTDKEAPDNMYG